MFFTAFNYLCKKTYTIKEQMLQMRGCFLDYANEGISPFN